MNETKKFIQHNLYHFKKKRARGNKVFLVEFNGWQALHIIFSYVVDFFKHEKDCKIVAYECYDFLNRVDPPWYNKYLWRLSYEMTKNNNLYEYVSDNSTMRTFFYDDNDDTTEIMNDYILKMK